MWPVAMPEIPRHELDEIHRFAIQLGKDAGRILLNGIEKRRLGDEDEEEAIEKLNAVDIVTKTDNGKSSFIPP